MYKMMMEIHWLKDMMNQLEDCKIDMMMVHRTETERPVELDCMRAVALLAHHILIAVELDCMRAVALLGHHKLMAVGLDCMRAVALLTHKTVENQNYTMRELGCSLELERTHMRVMPLLVEHKNSNKKIQCSPSTGA